MGWFFSENDVIYVYFTMQIILKIEHIITLGQDLSCDLVQGTYTD